ncbi:MAG: hypothetical protein FWG15_07365 [Propionibacteriaceae bacterium]|nr:hypothetical protein [Propionibacteriaceae bacterium]
MGLMAVVSIGMVAAGCAEKPEDLPSPTETATGTPSPTETGEETHEKGAIAMLLPVDGWEAPTDPDLAAEFDYVSQSAAIAINVVSLEEVNKQTGTKWEVQDYMEKEIFQGLREVPGLTSTSPVPLTGGNFAGYELTFIMTADDRPTQYGLIAAVDNDKWVYEVYCVSYMNPPDSDWEECREMIRNIALF